MPYNILKRTLTISFLVILAGFFSGCQTKQQDFDYTFAGNTWNRFIPAECTFEITDTKEKYSLDIFFSVWDQFNMSVIPFDIVITYPNEQESVLTRHVSIKDIDGKHLGNVVGDVWTVKLPVFHNRSFAQKGSYKISVINRTQYYNLQNVSSMSFSIYPSKQVKNN